MVLSIISDPKILLLRNAHPHFYDNGRVGGGAFAPTEEHESKLSVDDSTKCSPKTSYLRHRDAGLQSAGVFGLTVEEFDNENVEVVADPLPENDAHALADFEEVRQISKSQVKKAGRRLAAKANTRGKLS